MIIGQFEKDLSVNLARLRTELNEQTYFPLPPGHGMRMAGTGEYIAKIVFNVLNLCMFDYFF
ncbi:MAG: hypothetical protein KKC76_13395 [Proteobacteria bacterium]|nr:hypothetical protein [Pseudomonadota bacterium]